MISVIVYGRNDSYGYNLHKRAAISLNCIAAMLSDPRDEIIYVDYNTPDDFPTFPEAIQDILTHHAKSKLRTIRVRSSFHLRFQGVTNLSVIEAIARNIGARRSNPENKWLFSTNTDIILIPQKNMNLPDYARTLKPGIYHAPRLEIPETLWEFLDRTKPDEIIRQISQWGSDLHLNEIVYGSDIIRYDAPGDFQLIDRKLFFDNSGFDESMLLGWHVDSNIAARLKLICGEIGDAGTAFFAYHCDHTRQMTPIHRHDRTMNCHHRYVDSITSPCLPEQKDTWGAPDVNMQEIRLDGSVQKIFLDSLRADVGDPLLQPYKAFYTSGGFDNDSCDERHVLPYLVDLFFAMPRDMSISWFGKSNTLLQRFARVWKKLGFTQDILVDKDSPCACMAPGIRPVAFSDVFRSPAAYVFDYKPECHRDRTDAPDPFVSGFLEAIVHERTRAVSHTNPLRRFIGINAINTRFERIFRDFVSAGATPFSARLRHGYALPASKERDDWLDRLLVGKSGVRRHAAIENRPGETDYICYGPYQTLLPGRYRLWAQVDPSDKTCLHAYAIVELVSGNTSVLLRKTRGCLTEEFIVPRKLAYNLEAGFEFRVRSTDGTVFCVQLVGVELLSNDVKDESPNYPLALGDCLDFLCVGQYARRKGANIYADCGTEGFVCFGPYCKLPPGTYQVMFACRITPKTSDACVRFEIIERNQTILTAREVRGDDLIATENIVLSFDVFEDHQTLEFRVWTNGGSQIEIFGQQLSRDATTRTANFSAPSTNPVK